MKILKQADQNVPEFLLEAADINRSGDGAQGQSYSNRNRYGGRDVRNDMQEQSYQSPEEDDWGL